MNPTLSPWLTAREAAALLRVDINVLRRYAAQGLVPAYRVGRLWRFHRETLTGGVLSKEVKVNG